MKDTFGRNINYFRVSVTDLCNLRCKYCMPEKGIYKKKHEQILTLEEIFQVVKASTDLGINKVRLTGGEPLVRKGLTNLIERISDLQEVKDIALTTNGILLKKYAKELKEAGLKRVNISIDSLNEEKYREITRGGELRDVLLGIEEAKKVGFYPIKINVVLIGEFNDNEIVDFANLTMKEEIEIRFIELMPFGQASSWTKHNFVSNTLVKEKIKELIPIYNEDKHSPAKYYKIKGSKGKIGLINPISSHFCMYCNRIRMTADGKLKPCLHSNQEIDIKNVLRKQEGYHKIKEIIREAIITKPYQHTLNEKNMKPIVREMVQIGG